MKSLILSIFLLLSKVIFSQIVIDDTFTPQRLVEDILAGNGVTLQNISYVGSVQARAYFNSVNSNVGIDAGVILSTGPAVEAIAIDPTGGVLGFPGDSLLNNLIDASSVDGFDAAVLEFYFFPTSDTIRFRYVFASQEYPEFVCSEFNDIFGFFISGPNPNGGNYQSENLALVPGTTTPVAINSVNTGISGIYGADSFCNALDPQWRGYTNYYNDNQNSTDNTVIAFNGLTDVLTAKAAVIPCERYRIKLAIQDVGDATLTSAVFVEESSFAIGERLEVNFLESEYKEGCDPAVLELIRFGNLDKALTLNIDVSGTAENGVDYTNIPSQVTFDAATSFPLPLSDTIRLEIFSIYDQISELEESVTMTISAPIKCSPDTVITKTFTIGNVDPMSVSLIDTVSLCVGDSVLLSPIVTGGIAPYTYLWSNGNSEASTWVNSDALGLISVDVSNICEVQSVSQDVWVQLNTPNTLDLGSDTVSCEDLNLTLDAGSGFTTYLWQDGSTDQLYEVTGPGTFWVRVSNICGLISDTIVVGTVSLNAQILGETAYCGQTNISLNAQLDNPDNESLSFSWFQENNLLQNGTTTLNYALPMQDTWVKFVAMVTDKGCMSSDSIYVTFTQADTVVLTDTSICQYVPLSIQISTGSNFIWDPATGVQQVSNSMFIFTPEMSGSYDLTYSDDCGQERSTSFNIDLEDVAEINLGMDKTLCYDAELLVQATQKYADSIIWMNLTKGNTLDIRNLVEINDSILVHATAYGCGSDTDSVTIFVQNCDCRVIVPNAFTPDGDGLNDNFNAIIECSRLEDFHILIFNRWGNRVYESTDPNFNWSGVYRGNVQVGTYVWEIRFTGSIGGEYCFKGAVLLLN